MCAILLFVLTLKVCLIFHLQSLVNPSISEIPKFAKLTHLQLIIQRTFPWTSITS